MTKFTFANQNVIVVEGYKIGNALPNKAPSLKIAAQIAINEIEKGITSDSIAIKEIQKGEIKDVAFENGAFLTIPAEYEASSYKQALQIVVDEIKD